MTIRPTKSASSAPRQLHRGRIFTPVSREILKPNTVPQFRYFEDGALIVDSATGKITDVGHWKDLGQPAAQAGFMRFDHSPNLLLPGFIDTHVHLPQLAVAGRSGLELLGWLDKYIFPAENKFRDTAYARAAAKHFFRQLRMAGTTTAAVMTALWPEATDAAFEEAQRAGLRILMGNVLMDQNPSPATPDYIQTTQQAVDWSTQLCEKWHGQAKGLLHYLFTPRFAITCSRELMTAVSAEARRLHAGTHTHINENHDEVAYTRQLHPWARDYTDIYLQTGIIGADQRSILAHQLHVSDEQLARLNGTPTCIAHCPTSNFALRGGADAFNFWRVYGDGARSIGLGSDVGAGPLLSLFDVMRHSNYFRDPGLNVYQLWQLATRDGALALGLETGALEAGLEADFIVVDPRVVNPGDAQRPLQDLEETLLVLMNRSSELIPVVQNTFVRGREVFRQTPKGPEFC